MQSTGNKVSYLDAWVVGPRIGELALRVKNFQNFVQGDSKRLGAWVDKS